VHSIGVSNKHVYITLPHLEAKSAAGAAFHPFHSLDSAIRQRIDRALDGGRTLTSDQYDCTRTPNMNYGNYRHRPSHRILLTILSQTLRHRHYTLILSSHGTAGTVLVFESLAVLERMRMCRTNTYRTFLSLKLNATLPDTVDTIRFLNSSLLVQHSLRLPSNRKIRSIAGVE